MALRFIFLTSRFFEDYAHCPEIENKPDRPHIRICVTVGGVDFAIPMRSHIIHPHAFITDKARHCWLDYSKAIVLMRPDLYVDQQRQPRVRQNEFEMLRGKEYIIKRGMLRYINLYIKAKQQPDIPRNATLLRYSTLQCFEQYLPL